jgi:hypothetical protein
MVLAKYLPADSVLRRLDNRHVAAAMVARQFAADGIFNIDYGAEPSVDAAARDGTRELCRRVAAVYHANAQAIDVVAERLLDKSPTVKANLNNVISVGRSLAVTHALYPSISDSFATFMLASLSRDIEWLRHRMEIPQDANFDSFAELHAFRTTIVGVVFSLCNFSWPGPTSSPAVAYDCARAVVIPFVPIDSAIDLLNLPRFVCAEVQESLKLQFTKAAHRAASDGVPVDRVREQLSSDRVPQPLINSMLPG